MKKEIAEAWVKDLRSNPPQCKGTLYNGEGYCCLGRLCVVFDEEFERIDFDNMSVPFVYAVGANIRVLPDEIVQKAGMRNSIGSFNGGNLAGLNDSGYTFTQIADIIEKHSDEL